MSLTIHFPGSVVPTIFIIIGESALALIVGAVLGKLLVLSLNCE